MTYSADIRSRSLARCRACSWAHVHTAQAAGLPVAEELLPSFYAVAGINLCLQSLPLILVMSLLRHPLVGAYLSPGRPLREPPARS